MEKQCFHIKVRVALYAKHTVSYSAFKEACSRPGRKKTLDEMIAFLTKSLNKNGAKLEEEAKLKAEITCLHFHFWETL